MLHEDPFTRQEQQGIRENNSLQSTKHNITYSQQKTSRSSSWTRCLQPKHHVGTYLRGFICNKLNKANKALLCNCVHTYRLSKNNACNQDERIGTTWCLYVVEFLRSTKGLSHLPKTGSKKSTRGVNCH